MIIRCTIARNLAMNLDGSTININTTTDQELDNINALNDKRVWVEAVEVIHLAWELFTWQEKLKAYILGYFIIDDL